VEDLATDLPALHAQIAACDRCRTAGYFVERAPVVAGPASARIVVIGQAPAKAANTVDGLPFSGAAGRRLFTWLQRAGWDEATFRSLAYFTAVTKCYPGPGANGKGDRAPSRREQELCRPFLEAEFRILRPHLVLPVGRLAIEQFVPGRFVLADVVGRSFQAGAESLAPDAWIVPLPHPSGASLWLNRPEHRRLVDQAITKIAELRQALI